METKKAPNLSNCLSKAFNLGKENIGLFFGMGALAILVSILCVPILLGPIYAGMILTIMRLIEAGDGEKPKATDIFKGFDLFGKTCLLMLGGMAAVLVVSFVASLIPIVGSIIGFIAGILIHTCFIIFAMYLVIYKDQEPLDAAKNNLELVKPDLVNFAVFVGVAQLIGGLGAILCVVGIFWTYPLGIAILCYGYREVFNLDGEDPVEVEPLPVDDPPPSTDAPIDVAPDVEPA
jgi:hypothetical protein